MYNRIFKNWKTTLLGCVILLGSGLLVYAGKATYAEASVGLVGIVGILYKKKDEK